MLNEVLLIDVLCRFLHAKGRSTFIILIHDISMVHLNNLLVFFRQGSELERIEGDVSVRQGEAPFLAVLVFAIRFPSIVFLPAV